MTKEKLLLGSHVGMSSPDYLVGSFNEAISYKANAFMIYTGPNQSTLRTDLSKLKIPEFRKLLEQNSIDINNVVVHAPYIVNLANQDAKKRAFAISFISNELKRTDAIGCKLFVLHPGSAVGVTRQQGLDYIVEGINTIYAKNKINAILCLETMSGKGNELGINIDEIAYLIKNIKDRSHIGVCVDTCHISDAGYDDSQFDKYLKEFDEKIGLKYLKVLHINDSMNPIGSHKDRHENIGYGKIGFKTLYNIVHNPKLDYLPKILETPWYKDHPLYEYEIESLRTGKWIDAEKIIDKKVK